MAHKAKAKKYSADDVQLDWEARKKQANYFEMDDEYEKGEVSKSSNVGDKDSSNAKVKQYR